MISVFPQAKYNFNEKFCKRIASCKRLANSENFVLKIVLTG